MTLGTVEACVFLSRPTHDPSSPGESTLETAGLPPFITLAVAKQNLPPGPAASL